MWLLAAMLTGAARRSGRLFVVERGNVGDADDQAILGEKPGHRLSPRLCAGRVQQLEARALKLTARRFDGFGVLHLELDRCLGDHPVRGPLRCAKARLSRLRERPHTEVLAAEDPPAGVVAIA